ncbi:MAG TPA: acyltransferase [Candidatus Nitrosocosmicus sp.]|nr:acyltransferase [Candidatus Nitrosocosmicus sp.]
METVGNNKIKKKGFLGEIAFIRGIACLCVLMVHVSAAYFYENGQTFNATTKFLNQVSRFGTPAFAMLSGFLLYNQLINRNFTVKRFLQSRFTKILMPFVIWSLIYLALKWNYNLFNFPKWNSAEEVKEFFYIFLSGKSQYHLYFIAVVVQFYILFPLLRYFKSKQSLIILTLIAFYINYFFSKYPVNLGSGYLNMFISERGFILHWIYYFLIGGLLVHYWEKIIDWTKNNRAICFWAVGIIIIGAVFEYSFTMWIASNRAINMITLPILFIALSGIYYALSSASKVKEAIVSIGNLSMGIYLVHPLILFYIQHYDMFNSIFRVRYLPLIYLTVLAACIAIVLLIAKLPFGQFVVTISEPKKAVPKPKETPIMSAG